MLHVLEPLQIIISANLEGSPIHIWWVLEHAPLRHEIHHMANKYMQWDEQVFLLTAEGPHLVNPISSGCHKIVLPYHNGIGHWYEK